MSQVSQATREMLCCGRYSNRREDTDASLTAGLWPLGGDVASQLVWHCHKACGKWREAVFQPKIIGPARGDGAGRHT